MVREYGREHDFEYVSLPLYTHVSIPDFEHGTDEAYDAIAEASHRLIMEQVKSNKAFQPHKSLFMRGLKKIEKIIRDKVDIKKQYKEMKELGKKHGPVFLCYAIALEIVEDIVIPAILTSIGKPHLIPFALAFHSEPIMFPLYFGVRKMLKKKKKGLMKSYTYVVLLTEEDLRKGFRGGFRMKRSSQRGEEEAEETRKESRESGDEQTAAANRACQNCTTKVLLLDECADSALAYP
jgi:hypothetical protein